MAALLKAHEGLGNFPQMADGGVIGILELLIPGASTRIAHAPVFKCPGEGWALTAFLQLAAAAVVSR
jgi:hypothetical protein